MPEESKIASPCIRNCCLDGEDICLGCFRHVDEIVEWGGASEQRKLKILDTASLRKKRNQQKYNDL